MENLIIHRLGLTRVYKIMLIKKQSIIFLFFFLLNTELMGFLKELLYIHVSERSTFFNVIVLWVIIKINIFRYGISADLVLSIDPVHVLFLLSLT